MRLASCTLVSVLCQETNIYKLQGLKLYMQYEWDSRGRVINWSDSNFICTIRDGFNELKNLLEGDAYRRKSAGDDSVLHMEDVWQDHLKDKMQEEGYRKMLEVVIQNKFVQCGEGQVSTVSLQSKTP